MPSRFDMDARDYAKVVDYFEARARQALFDGLRPVGAPRRLVHEGTEWGAEATAANGEVEYQSVYVYAQARGQGHMRRYVEALRLRGGRLVTVPDCNIEAYLEKSGVEFRVVSRFTAWPEYQAITGWYGDRRSERSGVLLMNHIDEGLAVLARVEAGEHAMRAFCLHPLIQGDEDLAANYPRIAALTDQPPVLTLALEYRNIANASLSQRPLEGPDDIPLSPLPEVSFMLIADKVQNYKDFLRYHAKNHPGRDVLDRYFRLWLERLGLNEAQWREHMAWISTVDVQRDDQRSGQ